MRMLWQSSPKRENMCENIQHHISQSFTSPRLIYHEFERAIFEPLATCHSYNFRQHTQHFPPPLACGWRRVKLRLIGDTASSFRVFRHAYHYYYYFVCIWVIDQYTLCRLDVTPRRVCLLLSHAATKQRTRAHPSIHLRRSHFRIAHARARLAPQATCFSGWACTRISNIANDIMRNFVINYWQI